MSKDGKRAIALAERVEWWQKHLTHLGLGHWRIDGVTLTDEMPGGRSSNASVAPSQTYNSVWFWFLRQHVKEATEQQLDESIVHEWLHVVWRDLDVAISDADDFLSAASLTLWTDRVKHETEGVIEGLARQIVALEYATRA